MQKIILADNQAIFRTGAAKVLAVEDDLRIVAQAENSEKMLMALEKFHATVDGLLERVQTPNSSQ